MRRIIDDKWNYIREISQWYLLPIERNFEAYIAKELQEADPNLDDYKAEKYSRNWNELPDEASLVCKAIHKKLRKGTCRSCKQPLPRNYVTCEWSFNLEVCLCEKCHMLILTRSWIEELFESISEEIKKYHNNNNEQDESIQNVQA